MIKPSIAVMAFILAPSLLNAQSTDDFISESDYLDELPIILSATRLSQPLRDTPQAMTVIGQDLIQASGAQTIPDIFRIVPGFQVGQVTGSVPTVTYHGMSDRYARNMQVLVDGRSIYNAGYGGVDWTSLPLNLDDIERIEIIRGPNAASYGANAFSATINIISKHPSEQLGTLTRVTLGEKQTRQISISHAGQIEKLDYRLSIRQRESNGLISRYDDYDTSQIAFRGDYQLNIKDKLLFQASYSQGTQNDGFETGPGNTDTVFQPQRSIGHSQNSQQLKWSRLLSAENELVIQLYHTHQDINDDFQTMLFSEFDPNLVEGIIRPNFAEGDQRLNLGNSVFSHRYDLELQHNFRLNPDWRVSWGLGGREDIASGKSAFATDGQFKRQHIRSFINTEWYIQPDLVMNAGTMLESYQGFTPIWSPRAALNLHLNQQHTVRISATQAYRMPTLLESNIDNRAYFQNGKTFDFINNTSNPQAERIRSYEIGYLGELVDYSFNWDIKLFRDELSSLIRDINITDCLEALDSNPSICDIFDSIGVSSYRGTFSFDNAGDTIIKGLEIGGQWQISEQTLLNFAYSYAQSESSYRLSPGPDSLKHIDNEVPKKTYSLLLHHSWTPSLNSSLIFYYQDELKWRGEGNLNPQYQRLDARISKVYKRSHYRAELNILAQNLGSDYTDFQNENIVDRTLLAEFKLFVD